MASLLFFLFNRPFVACACGSRLLVLFAKIVICPERSNHSALFSCCPASMGCTSLSGRSLSEAFRLLCGCRIVAVVSRAEFVPSGGDIRFFGKRHSSHREGTFDTSGRNASQTVRRASLQKIEKSGLIATAGLYQFLSSRCARRGWASWSLRRVCCSACRERLRSCSALSRLICCCCCC